MHIDVQNKVQKILELDAAYYMLGKMRPWYIWSNKALDSGLRSNPLLLACPVPKQIGQTSFPLPATRNDHHH